MAEIIKIYRERIPAMRFIGKKYAEFGHWGEWFGNGWFDEIEAAMGDTDSIRDLWKDGGAYIGLERHCDREPFEYWLGMFTPAGTEVPEGFQFIDFTESHLGICWIYGNESETHGVTWKCAAALESENIQVEQDENGAIWSFENCTCPRYTTPDENGKVILDYCYFVK